ncbi:hypothetical protein [Pseudonocardia nigra]|uniref:hypothetical protein n=1 Tax=Pseudonocardia nigra TaxID=1921578 RepID=UPI001C5DD80C|nr:hypothetical protein [Pseudonocardia nigra]
MVLHQIPISGYDCVDYHGRDKSMVDRMQYPETDPRHHTIKLRNMLDEAADHAREDVGKIDDPRGQALFETSAEVLGGLSRALSDFEARNEPAWQDRQS